MVPLELPSVSFCSSVEENYWRLYRLGCGHGHNEQPTVLWLSKTLNSYTTSSLLPRMLYLAYCESHRPLAYRRSNLGRGKLKIIFLSRAHRSLPEWTGSTVVFPFSFFFFSVFLIFCHSFFLFLFSFFVVSFFAVYFLNK